MARSSVRLRPLGKNTTGLVFDVVASEPLGSSCSDSQRVLRASP
jgi:hypothetical protein